MISLFSWNFSFFISFLVGSYRKKSHCSWSHLFAALCGQSSLICKAWLLLWKPGWLSPLLQNCWSALLSWSLSSTKVWKLRFPLKMEPPCPCDCPLQKAQPVIRAHITEVTLVPLVLQTSGQNYTVTETFPVHLKRRWSFSLQKVKDGIYMPNLWISSIS